MMVSMTAKTIREEVRKAFKMTDAELLDWFNRHMVDAAQKPKAKNTEIDTLRLLRDALVQEAKTAKPKVKRKRTTAPSGR